MNRVERIPLRVVGNSIYLRVPADYVKAKQLRPGDIALWDTKNGNFRIVQLATFKDPSVLQEEVDTAWEEMIAVPA
jgi:hypothetical protein